MANDQTTANQDVAKDMGSEGGGRGPVKNISGKIAQWQQRTEEHEAQQLINPFSGWEGSAHREALRPEDEGYGRPVKGSRTEVRGKQAGVHVSSEIVNLCQHMSQIGTNDSSGCAVVKFGTLFESYTNISNKLVGMLIRARKQGLVQFDGEILFQRRDDHVPITLLHLPDKRSG